MHTCRWMVWQWNEANGKPALAIHCGGPSGCGATAAVEGIDDVLTLYRWLARQDFDVVSAGTWSRAKIR